MGHNFGEEQGEFFFGNSAFSSRFLMLCITVLVGEAAMDLCSGADEEIERGRGGKG